MYDHVGSNRKVGIVFHLGIFGLFILTNLCLIPGKIEIVSSKMDLSKLIEAGEKFGLSGQELKDFIKDQQDRARDERAELLELKKTENETAHLNLKIVENQKELKSNVKTEVNRAQARTPKLPTFNEDKDDLDAYLIRYEHYAKVQGG